MFKEKVVLVTGSSRSLGKEIIKKFANEGAKVVINYNNSLEEANQLKKEFADLSIENLIVKCDVSKEEEVKEMVKTIVDTYGKIDILVNNAGICNDTLFDKKTKDDFEKVIGVNLIGTYLVSKYVGEIMLKQKSGKIINIASDNGLHECYPESCDYDSS